MANQNPSPHCGIISCRDPNVKALVLTDLTRLLIDWFAQAKVIRFAHEMKNGETGEVAAGAVLVAVHIE